MLVSRGIYEAICSKRKVVSMALSKPSINATSIVRIGGRFNEPWPHAIVFKLSWALISRGVGTASPHQEPSGGKWLASTCNCQKVRGQGKLCDALMKLSIVTAQAVSVVNILGEVRRRGVAITVVV
ncbi:hypothetical protein BV22DRAFT_117547 [Leucogyrophana mollusca]|uniref:Uncharacterized protein n=1 Tax=Leucogyrophana mollusca TaxID=85980 RepID=A0ACB8BVE8_9AGAM|nr:hypothetical protein BV22DRAFT_117547 [Leucogyrophana mollusca]